MRQLPFTARSGRVGRKILVRTDAADGTHGFADWLHTRNWATRSGSPCPTTRSSAACDSLSARGDKCAVATLVERTSRFLVLVPLTERDSLTVTQAIISVVGPLPASIKRSLTRDCGAEMALHKDVTATRLPLFFAHPHSPSERGSDENDRRGDQRRLRKIHIWKNPSEVFTELLESDASTA